MKIYNEKIGETLIFEELDCGLRVYIVPKKGFSKAYAVFGTKYGSINNRFVPVNESEEISVPDGIAHYLEHKLFEDEDANAFDKFSKTGASANAYTSFVNTEYYFSSTSKFEENLDILLNFVSTPYFTDESVQKEQGIIGQEIKMYDDDPSWRVLCNFLKCIYHTHPIRRDIAGTASSIAKIDKELLYKCYNSYYNLSNMALVMVGDFDEEKVLLKVKEKFKNEKRVKSNVVSIFDDEEKSIHHEFSEEKLLVSAPIFYMGFKDSSVPMTGEELFRKTIITEFILEITVGKSSEFYKDLYEKGLINQSFASEFMSEESFGVVIMGGESKDPRAVYKYLKENLASLRERITKDELKRVKKAQYGRFVRMFNDTGEIAMALATDVLKGANLFNYDKVIFDIKLEELLDRFDELFKEEYMALSVINTL